MAELARLPAVGNSTAPEDAMLEAGLTPFLPGALDEADEAVRAEKARMLAEKKAQRKATNKRALVDPIISSKRLEVYGRWMSRKTARFRLGYEGDPKSSGNRRSAHGVVSLLEVAGGEQMFKFSFRGLYISNPDDSPLFLYVTPKKARKTVGDVEQSCTRVEMEHRDDGCIGHEGTSGTFEQVVTGVADPLQIRGLYIIKPARAKPETSEAIIFAFGNLEDFALEIPVSSEVLGVQAARDGIDQLKARLEAQRGRAAVQGVDQTLSLTTVRRQAQRAWRKFRKSPRMDTATFEEFKEMLNYLDIIVLEPRAVKLFTECDLDHSKHIEIGELEIALLMNATLPPDTHLTPTDAFATFDLDGAGFIDELEFMEAIQVLGIDISTPKREKKVTHLFGKIDTLGSGTVDQGQFLQLWAQLVHAPDELRGRGIPPAIGPKSKKKNVQKLLDALAQEQVDRDAAFHRVKMDAIKMKYDERKRHEEKAREQQQETTQENREAKREQAKRDKSERIRRRKEQEEITKRQKREQQLKRKMEEAKLERERKVKEDFHNERVQKAEEELAERRKRREDRVELAQMGIRDLPPSVYEGTAAQFKLSNLVSIDVSRNKISRWPEKNFMFWLASLRRLDMSHNRFADLPGKELDAMGELQILRLNNNVLRHLPDTLGGLHSLQRLDLSQNHLSVLPHTIAALSRLEVLNVSGNELTAVPHEFGDLESLRTCDLSKNRLFELPDEFPLLRSLTKLDLSGNVLVELPEDFGAMTTLRSLNCSGNRIVNVPETFRHLHLLDALSFRDNSLRDIDAWVSGMNSLVEMDISSNLVQHVDPHISTLSKLQYIDLSNNVSAAFVRFYSLRAHTLMREHYTYFFPVFARPPTVLSHQKILETPKEFGMMKSLEVMKLQRNAIPIMLPEIGGLQQMHHLDMSHSKIQGGLPEEFGLLQLLITCDLSHNLISDIPNNVAALVRLELFDVSHNQLVEIPSAIENLTALRTLNLASNRLESLPLALGPAMHALEQLDVSCNRLTGLPQPVSGGPTILLQLWTRMDGVWLT